MGTHPIFESDFDCLTDKKNRKAMMRSTRNSFRLISASSSWQIQSASRRSKKIEKRFSRGIEREDEVGKKSSYYDRLGYWDSKYTEINLDESVRHGVLIPKIPIEDIGVESLKGRRRKQEDRYLIEKLSENTVLVAVFDGHGNDLCATYARDNFKRFLQRNLKRKLKMPAALKKTITDIDQAFSDLAIAHQNTPEEFYEDKSMRGQSEQKQRMEQNPVKSGSTCMAVVIEDGYVMTWAWVGDSRAILCRNGVAKRLTFDHSLEMKNNPLRQTEFDRIIAAGAEVTESDGEYRVHVPDHGSINMTRAIGDVQLKKYGITAEPCSFEELPIGDPDYARITTVNHNCDAFLVLLSDGVSGPLSVSEIISQILSRDQAVESARHLVETALHMGSTDNCTAIVVPLGAWGKYREPSSNVRYLRNFIGSYNRY